MFSRPASELCIQIVSGDRSKHQALPTPPLVSACARLFKKYRPRRRSHEDCDHKHKLVMTLGYTQVS